MAPQSPFSPVSTPTQTISPKGRNEMLRSILTKETQGVYIIPIMGPTGAGKSTFINQLAGETVADVGESFISCTKELQPVEIPADKVEAHLPLWVIQPGPLASNSAKKLVLVDTPGFDDTTADDSEILKRIASWLAKTYGSGTHLSGIIYLQDISATRYTKATKRNFDVFNKLCGADACKSVILGTTKWPKEDHRKACKKEEELRNVFWKGMLDAGSTMDRVDDPRVGKSPWHLVESVLFKGESPVLQIQKELRVMRMELQQTEAAQVLRARIDELISSLQNTGATKEELKALRQDLAALKEKASFLRFFTRFLPQFK